MARQYIASFKESHIRVYSDERFNEHMLAHKDCKLADLAQAISLTEAPSGCFTKATAELDHCVGKCGCIAIDSTCCCTYATRIGRQGQSHIVLNKVGYDTNCLTFCCVRRRDGNWYAVTAFAGPGDGEPEPWDRKLVPGTPDHARSLAYWNSHALVYDPSAFSESERERIASLL